MEYNTWSSSEAPSTDKHIQNSQHHDLITFLAASQRLKVDLLPITWQTQLGVLGTGGTARVNQSAVDLRTSFAYKRMYAEARSYRNYERLTVEVAALKSQSVLRHPNIVQLEGICWELQPANNSVLPVLVFEKADHGDLKQFMAAEGRTVDLGTRAKWCTDLTGALHSLHISGIVHGDIKPGNVLVFKSSSGNSIVKIADFGYAAYSGNNVELRHTWPWNAPEWHPRTFTLTQAKRADVYSLGMLCLWILFIDRSTETGATVATEALTPPDESSDRQTVDGMKQRDELPALVGKLLERQSSLQEGERARLMAFFLGTIRHDPQVRQLDLIRLSRHLAPEGADELPRMNELHVVIGGFTAVSKFQVAPYLQQLVMAIPEARMTIVDALKEKAKDCKCHELSTNCPEKLNAALQLAFCYKIGLGVAKDNDVSASWLAQSGEKPEVLDDIIEGIRQEKQVPTFQEGLFKRLWDEGHVSKFDFAEYHRGKGSIGDIESRYRREIKDISDALSEKHGAVLALKSILAGIFIEEGHLQKAVELEEQVLDANLTVLGPYDHTTIMTTGSLALSYGHLGQWKKSEEVHRDLLHRCEKVLGNEHPSTIGAMANLGSVLRLQGFSQEAEDLDTEMVKRQQKVFGPEHPETISAILNLAATYRSRNSLNKAAELEERVLPIARRVLKEGHPVRIRAQSNLALTYDKQGRFMDAQTLLLETMESSQKSLGLEHPATMANMHNLALLYRTQGLWKQAEDLLRSVIDLQNSKFGQEHPDSLMSTGELSQTISEQGRWSEAQEMLLNTLEKMQRVFGKENPRTLATQGMVGANWIKLGQYEDAKTVLQEVIAVETRVNGQDHPSTLTTKQNLATAYMSNKEYRTAEELFKQVFEARRSVLGEDAVPTLISMDSLSSTCRYQKRLEQALEINQQVVQRMTRVLGDQHPRTLTSLSLQANILIEMKSDSEAELLLVPLLQTKEEVFGPEHPDTLNTAYALAMAYLHQGRIEKAMQMLRNIRDSRTRVLGPNHPDTKHIAELIDMQTN